MHLAAAFVAANGAVEDGIFKANSLEYGIFVTAYMVSATSKVEEVNAKADARMRTFALYMIMKAGSTQCFTEETLVNTEDGYKEIKDIKIGDEVLSENIDTKEIDFKPVKRVYVSESYNLITINIEDQELNTTEKHPFFVDGKGWVYAKDLKPEYDLVFADGNTYNIESIEVICLEEPVKVYNFEVDEWHTYFVGNPSCLVHNRCGDGWTRMTNKEAEKLATKELGYKKTNYRTKNGEAVFYNRKNKTYISQDVGSSDGNGPHNGGVWKMAKSPEKLNSKNTRMGTYDMYLENRVTD